MTGFYGPAAVSVFQATIIAHALEFYAKTGMKVNRAYTPANMMRTASSITGKKFKSRAYLEAAHALREWAQVQASTKCVSTGDGLEDASRVTVTQEPQS
jgi:hypothetical protein